MYNVFAHNGNDSCRPYIFFMQSVYMRYWNAYNKHICDYQTDLLIFFYTNAHSVISFRYLIFIPFFFSISNPDSYLSPFFFTAVNLKKNRKSFHVWCQNEVLQWYLARYLSIDPLPIQKTIWACDFTTWLKIT